jgi:hypothetical protein
LSQRLTARRIAPLIAAIVAVSSLTFGITTASAVVQVDPDGPAGQQYALPLDSVRGESAGVPSAGVPGSAEPAPLFGQGVRPAGDSGQNPDGSGGEQVGSGKDGSGKDGSGKDGTNSPTTVDGVEVGPEVQALINGTGGGSSTTLEIILLIGGMAVIGLVGGLIGRRTL